MRRLRNNLTYSNVVSTLCLFLLLGGGVAYAASQLGKNTVGTKQLKKNAVTTAKLKDGAVTGAKVADGSLTGSDIVASTLGTVPTADKAGVANSANSANVADSLAPSEGWQVVGALGEPGFLHSWKNLATPGTVAFYKDHEGVVHLRGTAYEGEPETPIFQLPGGYRPAKHEVMEFAVPCSPCNAGETGVATVVGPEGLIGEPDGAVRAPEGASVAVTLNGIAFRAES